jgi:hypothetical protein
MFSSHIDCSYLCYSLILAANFDILTHAMYFPLVDLKVFPILPSDTGT